MHSVWVDSEIAADGVAEPVRIEFGSSEYFELLAESTEIARWLSLGDQMQIVIDGTLYEIVPASVTDTP